MGLFDFLRNKATVGRDVFEKFYEVLAHGTDEQISKHIYRRDLMSPDDIQACVNVVAHHCRSRDEKGRLIEKEQLLSTSGEFALLIVVGSWVEDIEDNFVPLIVGLTRQLEIAGIVLPFNGLMTKRLGSAGPQIGELSATWVARKIAFDKVVRGTDNKA